MRCRSASLSKSEYRITPAATGAESGSISNCSCRFTRGCGRRWVFGSILTSKPPDCGHGVGISVIQIIDRRWGRRAAILPTTTTGGDGAKQWWSCKRWWCNHCFLHRRTPGGCGGGGASVRTCACCRRHNDSMMLCGRSFVRMCLSDACSLRRSLTLSPSFSLAQERRLCMWR